MRVAVCQMSSGADVEANLQAAVAQLEAAADGGADLAALPEYCTYLGTSAGRAEVAEPVPGPATGRLAAVARARGMWVLAGSVLERHEDRVFDTSVLIDRTGEVVAWYRKIHLYDVDLPGQPPFRESATITPGDQLVTRETEFARVGLSICYDLRFPELFRGLMVLGAEVLFVPAQFQFETGKDHWHVLLRARAIENQCFVVAPAQCGPFGDPEKGRRSYGHSLVVDPWGHVLAEGSEDEAGVWFADLDFTELRRVRQALPALAHRRLGLTC
jgi:deaminated glutathione amidase